MSALVAVEEVVWARVWVTELVTVLVRAGERVLVRAGERV
jgi:hypothetical protein